MLPRLLAAPAAHPVAGRRGAAQPRPAAAARRPRRPTPTPDEVLTRGRGLLRGAAVPRRPTDDRLRSRREKGYLRETGNLVFHLALLGCWSRSAPARLFGYQGNVLIIEGDGFANTLTAYDDFKPGRAFDADVAGAVLVDRSTPSRRLRSRGRAARPAAATSRRSSPSPTRRGAAARRTTCRSTTRSSVDGTRVYLHRPRVRAAFTVTRRQGAGRLRRRRCRSCRRDGNFTSDGVDQGAGRPAGAARLHRAVPADRRRRRQGKVVSAFPAAGQPPVARARAFNGDLGLDNGAPAVGVQARHRQAEADQRWASRPSRWPSGETLDAAGRRRLDHLRRRTSSGSPCRSPTTPAGCPRSPPASSAILGHRASLIVRRRRVWVRARAAEERAYRGRGRRAGRGLGGADAGASPRSPSGTAGAGSRPTAETERGVTTVVDTASGAPEQPADARRRRWSTSWPCRRTPPSSRFGPRPRRRQPCATGAGPRSASARPSAAPRQRRRRAGDRSGRPTVDVGPARPSSHWLGWAAARRRRSSPAAWPWAGARGATCTSSCRRSRSRR